MIARWLCVVALAAACSKQDDPPEPKRADPTLTTAEIKRGKEACEAYVTRVCACAETVAAAKEECANAKPLADAVQLASDLANAPNPEARKDALHGADALRKTTKTCIERTAQLPALGCPL